MTLVVVGDALLDRDIAGSVERLSPDAPVPVVDQASDVARPGGAGLAASLAAEGADVVLVTALGADEPGAELEALLSASGVDVVDLGLHGPTPEKVRVKAGDRSLLRLDRGGPGSPCGDDAGAAADALDGAEAVLVSDYGRGVAAAPRLRRAIEAAAKRSPLVWDPHPRGPAPVAGATLATPNESEAARFASEIEGRGVPALADRAVVLARRWGARYVCITRGGAGALLAGPGGAPQAIPAAPVIGGDPCGAGDCFAAAAALALARGAFAPEAAAHAVAAASAFVESGGAAAAMSRGEEAPATGERADRRIAAIRAAGGTIVATGGCFDLLHPGHVRTLESARALGDCLVVLLNSDASIRRLKGPDRPLVPQEDRAAVLEALGCVDAVVVFDEATPVAALGELRPHVWVKGGDYAGEELPEAAALRRWGGRAVVVPFVEGRSTTRLIEEARARVT
jgi:rfaE bifunctional protein nucleotidyltransferase chain/domain/rfaE bifunctional protein kinase chain/domain